MQNISDNYFDLLPGEPLTLDAGSPRQRLDQLRSAMKVMSLTEAFNPKESATAKNSHDLARR